MLEASVHDYIRYYNHERIKLELKGLSPVGQVIPGPIQNEQSVRAQLFKTSNQFARNLIPNFILTNRTKRINNRAGRVYTSQKIYAPRDC